MEQSLDIQYQFWKVTGRPGGCRTRRRDGSGWGGPWEAHADSCLFLMQQEIDRLRSVKEHQGDRGAWWRMGGTGG